MCGEEGRGSQEATVRFRYRLSDLKRNGSNILLVGTDALDAACERLLGESGAGRRYRLFVTADAGPATARSKLDAVSSPAGRGDAAVVDWQTDVRGAAAADGANGPTLREVTVGSDDLRDLGETVEEMVQTFDDESDGLSPAELRLCFDSLTPLLADYEGRDVRRFLLALTETVEAVNGMGHYHLPGEYGSETVESLEPLFDAVVEVRCADSEVQQRWHLQDPDVATDWLPL